MWGAWEKRGDSHTSKGCCKNKMSEYSSHGVFVSTQSAQAILTRATDRGVKQRTFIFSLFQRPEAGDQGAGEFGFCWDLSPWLADDTFSPRAHIAFPQCPWGQRAHWCLPLLIGHKSYWMRALSLWPHSILITCQVTLGLALQHMNFSRIQFLP